jgi:Lon protease-like protein
MNILTEGESRFRIRKFSGHDPFWRGVVELVDDGSEPESVLGPLRRHMAEVYVEAYRKSLALTGEKPGELQLPTSAVELSYMITYVLDMDVREKQRLLEMTSTSDRLKVLIDYVRDANERLDRQIHKQRVADTARGNGDLGRPESG